MIPADIISSLDGMQRSAQKHVHSLLATHTHNREMAARTTDCWYITKMLTILFWGQQYQIPGSVILPKTHTLHIQAASSKWMTFKPTGNITHVEFRLMTFPVYFCTSPNQNPYTGKIFFIPLTLVNRFATHSLSDSDTRLSSKKNNLPVLFNWNLLHNTS